MNEIGNEFLLAGHKLMPEMHLIQPLTYRQCLPAIYKKQRKNMKI